LSHNDTIALTALYNALGGANWKIQWNIAALNTTVCNCVGKKEGTKSDVTKFSSSPSVSLSTQRDDPGVASCPGLTDLPPLASSIAIWHGSRSAGVRRTAWSIWIGKRSRPPWLSGSFGGGVFQTTRDRPLFFLSFFLSFLFFFLSLLFLPFSLKISILLSSLPGPSSLVDTFLSFFEEEEEF